MEFQNSGIPSKFHQIIPWNSDGIKFPGKILRNSVENSDGIPFILAIIAKKHLTIKQPIIDKNVFITHQIYRLISCTLFIL